MIKVVKKEIDVEKSLRKRLEIICDFCNTAPIIIKDDTFEDMKETYIFSKGHDNRDKEKDDFDLEI